MAWNNVLHQRVMFVMAQAELSDGIDFHVSLVASAVLRTDSKMRSISSDTLAEPKVTEGSESESSLFGPLISMGENDASILFLWS